MEILELNTTKIKKKKSLIDLTADQEWQKKAVNLKTEQYNLFNLKKQREKRLKKHERNLEISETYQKFQCARNYKQEEGK